MPPWLTKVQTLLAVAFFAMVVIAIVQCSRNAESACVKRGGVVVHDDCPEVREVCSTNKHGTHCTEIPCKWRCVEHPR